MGNHRGCCPTPTGSNPRRPRVLTRPGCPSRRDDTTSPQCAPPRNSAGRRRVHVPVRAITVSKFGPPSVLVPSEVPTPVAGPGQVLVEVTGAGVGPWDAKLRQGLYGTRDFPYIPGNEISGIV